MARCSTTIALVGVLLSTGCSKAGPDGGATADSAVRTTSKTREWSVGGIVSGKSETITTEPSVPPPPMEEPAERQEPQPGLLTAGDTDDLINARQYAAYAGRFLQAHDDVLPFVDTRRRIAIRIVDGQGRGVPAAQIEVTHAGSPLRLTTAADGTASVYPGFDRVPARATVTVRSAAGDLSRTVDLQQPGGVSIALPGERRSVQALDLALVIDTTGSMGDEMAYLRAELDAIVARLRRDAGNLDLRIGIVLYRDQGDDYVVRSVPLTGDIGSIRATLAAQDADGGGDMPEAMDAAVASAGRLQWRADAAKAVLLVTDAPPHEENIGRAFDAAQQLRTKGVQVVPVAASGIDDTAQYVLRSIAALTQGRYIFLTDDSGVGDKHAEPDVACYAITRLDQLIARVLAGIVRGERVEAQPAEVIRTVGDYRQGRCLPAAQS